MPVMTDLMRSRPWDSPTLYAWYLHEEMLSALFDETSRGVLLASRDMFLVSVEAITWRTQRARLMCGAGSKRRWSLTGIDEFVCTGRSIRLESRAALRTWSSKAPGASTYWGRLPARGRGRDRTATVGYRHAPTRAARGVRDV
jgi:hypothetical protein